MSVDLLSVDGKTPLDVMAINGASAALSLSDIPWRGPLAAVRVGFTNGKFIFNAPPAMMKDSILDLLYVGTRNRTVMMEMSSSGHIPPEQLMEACTVAHKHIQPLINSLQELQGKALRQGHKKRAVAEIRVPFHIQQEANSQFRDEMESLLADAAYSKLARWRQLSALKDRCHQYLKEKYPSLGSTLLTKVFHDMIAESTRTLLLDFGRRSDGRNAKQSRTINAQAGFLPIVHGSSRFSSGGTRAICSATIGPEELCRYHKHSLFVQVDLPQYAVDHSNLDEETLKALAMESDMFIDHAIQPVLPASANFPYAIRVNPLITDHDGGAAAAALNSASLSLFDAGVPLQSTVAASTVAITALHDAVSGEIIRHCLLVDPSDSESLHSDMELRLARSERGITAIQMDCSAAPGVPLSLLLECIQQADKNAASLIKRLTNELKTPRKELHQSAPRNVTLSISEDMAHAIQSDREIIEESTGSQLDLLEDYGLNIRSPNKRSYQLVRSMLAEYAPEWKVGSDYTVRVDDIDHQRLIVEDLLTGKGATIPKSELFPATHYSVGDQLVAKCTDIDEEMQATLSARLTGTAVEMSISTIHKQDGEATNESPSITNVSPIDRQGQIPTAAMNVHNDHLHQLSPDDPEYEKRKQQAKERNEYPIADD